MDQIERYVFRLLEDHRRNRIDNHVRIWMPLNPELWFAMSIEGEDPAFILFGSNVIYYRSALFGVFRDVLEEFIGGVDD